MSDTVAEMVKGLRTLHFALLIGQVILLIVIYFLASNSAKSDNPAFDIYRYVIPGFLIGITLLSFFLFKRALPGIIKKESLQKKMVDYHRIALMQFAMIEAVGLISILFYFFSGDFLFLFYAFITIGLFFFLSPTPEKISVDLKLSSAEKEKLT